MLNRLKLVRNSFVRSGKEKKSSEIVIAHSEFDHNVSMWDGQKKWAEQFHLKCERLEGTRALEFSKKLVP